MNQISKLSLPATIILASLILGGFYYGSEVNKQTSIERQKLIEKEAKDQSEQKLAACLLNAKQIRSERWDTLCKAKGLESDCLQPLEVVEVENEKLNDARDECFKRYPQN